MRGSDEQPIFVIGNPRSGTSLLRLMLTSHPMVVIPPEAGFALWLHPAYAGWSPADGHQAFVDELLTTRKFEFWNLGTEEIVRSIDALGPEDYGALVAAVYRGYVTKVKPEATHWGDKNNFHITEIDRLQEIFPNARFVHIVRDGRNVAVSYRRLHERTMESAYAPDLPFDVAEIAQEWARNVTGAEEAMARIGDEGRVLTVRLEDLTSRPRETLDGVCGMLGLPFEDSMLEYHRLTPGEGGEPAEFLQWKERNAQPVEATDTGEYLRTLSPEEIRAFEEVAGQALDRFGYLSGV